MGQVCFRFLYLIDGGESFEGGGARVHRDYRNKHILKIMDKYICHTLNATHPRALGNFKYTAFWTDSQKMVIKERYWDSRILNTLVGGTL